MKFNLDALIRPGIKALRPYSSARDEYTGKTGIFLDANENSLGSVVDADLNRYPDPYSTALRETLAKLKSIDSDNIFAGNGSDEAISLLMQIFIEPGKEKLLITPPTYGMYQVAAAIQGAGVIEVPLDEGFELNLEGLLDALCPQLKIIFLCSPNNPSANLLSQANIDLLLREFPGIVVIDEAYIDFCEQESWLPKLDRYPNLVILQTLSKAWGLAGARLGFAFASAEIVKLFLKVKAPYNLNVLTQRLALQALNQSARCCAMVRELLDEREKLSSALQKLACVEHVFRSDANFLLVRFKNCARVFTQLKKLGIIVRDRSKLPGCRDCLRITVGSKSENQALLSVLKEI